MKMSTKIGGATSVLPVTTLERAGRSLCPSKGVQTGA